MSNKNLFIVFLIVIAFDVLNKNLYLAFADAHTSTKVYWLGQSMTFVGYIILVRLLAHKMYSISKDKWSLIFKLAALNWIAFGINDVFDEVFGSATETVVLEYFAFIITIPLTIIEWRKHIKQKT